MDIISKDKFLLITNITEYKKCNDCGLVKQINEFYNRSNLGRLSSYCKNCQIQRNNNYLRTFDGFFSHLAKGMQNSANKRLYLGRINAGDCIIDNLYLIGLFNWQQGRCFYSGIQMITQPHSSWKASPERLNNDLGYIPGNVVLICLEFNTTGLGWSRNKVISIPNLINQSIDLDQLRKEIDESRKRPKNKPKSAYRIITLHVFYDDGSEELECRKCHQLKRIDQFAKNHKDGCKNCRSIHNQNYANTLRGFLKNLLRSAMKSIKCSESRIQRGLQFNLTLNDLCDMILEQEGRCYYSGIPLVFKPLNHWKCSIERINNIIGYTRENCRLICIEFNSTDHTINAKSEVIGSSQWSKEKFQYFLTHIMNTN